MFIDSILDDKVSKIADQGNIVYKGKIDLGIAYIMPYADQKSSLYKPGQIETYFRLVNGENRPWRIFNDELNFQAKELLTYQGVKIKTSIKDGTEALIDTMVIYLNEKEVLKLSGSYLTLYPQELKKQLADKRLVSQQYFLDIFHLTIDNLFY